MHLQFEENIRKHGFKVWKDVEADGNCFFHSVVYILNALQVNKSGLTHKSLRENACQELRKNIGQYLNFIDSDPCEYLETIAQDGEWADHVIIQVVAELLERPILLINSDKENELVFLKPKNLDSSKGRTINLGYLNNQHYIALTRKL